MQSVQALIEKSKKKYEDEKKFPKARKWLLRATSVIQYYSSVIDVFAQISPEYVSLVWGSMRLVVTVSYIRFSDVPGYLQFGEYLDERNNTY